MGDGALAGSGVLLGLIALIGTGLFLFGTVRVSARRGVGLFHFFPYALLFGLATSIFLSGRVLSEASELLSEVQVDVNPVSIWIGRLVSILISLASVERIVSYAVRRHRSEVAVQGSAPKWLLWAFVVFWATTVASPVLFGAESSAAHDYVYTLLMGCAALLLSERESDLAVVAARNALLLFLAASMALIPLRPNLVLDWTYSEGFLPGVPRFAGLTTHFVSMGMLAQLALLCLLARPVSHRWANRACWALGLVALLLAQSKTSWLSFPVCAAAMFWARDVPASQAFGTLRQKRFRPYFSVALLIVVVGVGAAFVFGNLDAGVNSFLATSRGSNVATLSGREQIWAVALAEWARHPVFGYGTSLFDVVYRTDIGMPFAVNGHNQLIDTLARSGLVGAAGLLLYIVVLMVFSLRYARASRGLSIAIFLAIILRSVSEVPLMLFGYGPEVIEHFLLLAVLAGCASARAMVPVSFVAASDRTPYRDLRLSRSA